MTQFEQCVKALDDDHMEVDIHSSKEGDASLNYRSKPSYTSISLILIIIIIIAIILLGSARILRKVLSVWTEWLTWVTDALGAWFAPGWCTKRTPAKTVTKEIIIIIIYCFYCAHPKKWSCAHYIIDMNKIDIIQLNILKLIKKKRSDSFDSESVALMTLLTTPIFDFQWVISALTTQLTTLTPSLVKTGLKRWNLILLAQFHRDLRRVLGDIGRFSHAFVGVVSKKTVHPEERRRTLGTRLASSDREARCKRSESAVEYTAHEPGYSLFPK